MTSPENTRRSPAIELTLTREEIGQIRGILEQIRRDALVGRSLDGFLPRLPRRESLPTADQGLRYQVVVIPGTPDIPYFHGRDAGGAWGWRSLIGGGFVGAGLTLTIASGVITVTSGYHLVDTEAGGATDDIDTINGTVAGHMYVFRAANSARSVVFKDGTGNLALSADFTADNSQDTLTLISDGATLYEISRSDNGA